MLIGGIILEEVMLEKVFAEIEIQVTVLKLGMNLFRQYKYDHDAWNHVVTYLATAEIEFYNGFFYKEFSVLKVLG